MLNKKNKKPVVEASLTDKVDQDLIVHNMPNQAKLSGAVYSSKPAFTNYSDSSHFNNSEQSNKKNNFKIIGILIITLGIIFVLTLIYFSYRFIIQPKTENIIQQDNVESYNIVSDENKAEELNIILPATTTEIQIEAVDILEEDNIDLASSSAVLMSDILPPLVDSDSDGLNDFEEGILGTDISLVDSDDDTFNDLSELENGYNPAGTGKLVMNPNISEYNGKTYSLLYPAVWGVSSLNNDETVIITTEDNSLIQISSQDNENVQSILSWYEEYFPNILVTYDKLKKGSGWEGIMSPDNINFYLVDDMRDKIYVISYISAVGERVTYPNIFNFIIKSFSIK